MGARINSIFIASVQRIERRKRQDLGLSERNELPPLSKFANKAMTGQNSHPRPFQKIELGRDLQSQLLTNAMKPSEDEVARAENSRGLGDRRLVSSSQQDSSLTQKLPVVEAPDVKNLPGVIDENSASLLRRAIRTVTEKFILNGNSAEGLRDEVDRQFGAGISDLVNLRVENLGSGISAVRTDQVEVSELGLEEKEILETAIGSAKDFYKNEEALQDLSGRDIQGSLQKLDSLLGWRGKNLVADLKKSSNEPSDWQAVLQAARNSREDLRLSDEKKEKFDAILEELDHAAQKARKGFRERPFIDELEYKFHSRRNDVAYSPAEVATVLAITDPYGRNS